ncbi:carbamoyltransferase C-terminal domain-containing protein [Polymorphospora sp. NPDC051019]|uniref:carbamoyltransferase C-terminal domain-containing protein n=1 Tax=Polymorphospora sp. NPDC051019 TaxID=3155725 RepID=UPI003425D282
MANPKRRPERASRPGPVLARRVDRAGPRTLGNWSVLASTSGSEVVDRLNCTVTFCEPFRPLTR